MESSSNDRGPTTVAGTRQDVNKALHLAWLVAHEAGAPDLVAALACRTRDLQDGVDLKCASPEVDLNVDRHRERWDHLGQGREIWKSNPTSRMYLAVGILVGAVGAADWRLALDRRNRRNFMLSEPEGGSKPLLLDYWGLGDDVLQVICLPRAARHVVLPSYMAESPWPEGKSAMHGWLAVVSTTECEP